jgi:hypothetical protein
MTLKFHRFSWRNSYMIKVVLYEGEMFMNKQLLTTTLLSMLVVSCAGAPSSNPIGSVSSSNNSTPTSSTSSSSSSSSSSSPQGSTTVVSSSSSSSASSSSSSTSQTPVNTKKVSFNQIGSLVAQVVDAKALGVSNSKDTASEPKGRRQAQEDEVDSSEQNKMVKVTETYNPTTKVAEDKTLEVVFTRTTNTQTTELQTGMDTYVATADDITIERLTDEPGRVVIKNVANHEFRALNGDIILEDWTSGNQETIEFLFTKLETGTFTKVATAPDLDINALIQPDSPAGQIILTNNLDYEFRLMNGETELVTWTKYETDTITFEFDDELTPTIEARGVDATIIFDAIEGLTYDVTLGGVPVSSDITDNGSLDEDATAAKITISGLTEGLTYDIAFEGQLPDAALTDITIESRSTDASISFTAFEGFTYEVKSGETMIKANLKDNQEGDLNEKEGVITIKGLIQGLPYDVHYSGYVELETITQEEVDGQVDKLYVLYQFTFISFVPLTLNSRPEASLLENDYDDVALYDKTDYYSDSTRQSFVVDNETGLIYKIENTFIERISRGILWIKNNLVPHDMRITASGELEFFPLFTNETIIAFDAFKDKHGNTFIFNNRLNIVDRASKTTFFVSYVNYWGPPSSQLSRVYQASFSQTQLSVSGFAKGVTYWLTDTNEVLMVDIDLDYKYAGAWFKNIQLINESNERIDVPLASSYKIIDFKVFDHQNGSPIPKPFRITNGKLFSETISNNIKFDNDKPGLSPFRESGEFAVYDIEKRVYIFFELRGYPARPWNPSYLLEKDLLIEYANNNIYAINGVSLFLSQLMNYTIAYQLGEGNGLFRLSWGGLSSLVDTYNKPTLEWWRPIKDNPSIVLDYNLVLEDVGIVNGEVSRFEVNGNINYDLIVEDIAGKATVVPYVTGTYVAPPPAPITLQPINR